jgi:hypothetical protein
LQTASRLRGALLRVAGVDRVVHAIVEILFGKMLAHFLARRLDAALLA